MGFEQTPKIRSIIYMKKVKLRVEHGKSGYAIICRHGFMQTVSALMRGEP